MNAVAMRQRVSGATSPRVAPISAEISPSIKHELQTAAQLLAAARADAAEAVRAQRAKAEQELRAYVERRREADRLVDAARRERRPPPHDGRRAPYLQAAAGCSAGTIDSTRKRTVSRLLITAAVMQREDPARSRQPSETADSLLDGRQETELERYDRNLTELMGELRVALPGVQVLFAFLLVAPFNQRFDRVSQFERHLYFATLLLTLLASMLLIAPAIIHRLEFQRGEKAYVVQTANKLMIAGLIVFAIAMTTAVLLITHYLFGPVTAIITTIIVVAAFILIRFLLPLRRRRTRSTR